MKKKNFDIQNFKCYNLKNHSTKKTIKQTRCLDHFFVPPKVF